MVELDNPTNFRVEEKFSENNLYGTIQLLYWGRGLVRPQIENISLVEMKLSSRLPKKSCKESIQYAKLNFLSFMY